MRQQPVQKVGGRQEVGVEDADVAAPRHCQSSLERAGLVAGSIRAVDVLDVDALRHMPPHRQLRDLAGFVGRVVQHLNFEQLARVVEATYSLDEAIGDVHFVVDRELEGDDRERVERLRFDWLGFLMPHVKIHEVVAVPAVDGQNAQDEEITDEDESVRRSHSVSNADAKTSADYTPIASLTDLQQLLDQVRAGQVPPAAAAEQVLQLVNAASFQNLGFARVDHHRAQRQGFPEVVFGLGKTPQQVAAIAAEIVSHGHTLLVTRASEDAFAAVKQQVPDAEFQPIARTITYRQKDVQPGRGTILIAAAGTSDLPVAEEACVTAEVMGNTVDRLFDVGVAGIHRLLGEHQRLASARAVIVVAGMEGALPSVIGGLVRVPVIAVPTSIGYGASFGGLAALLGMLNSCAAGVSVVNIDNGFGAAAIASRINHL